MDPKPKTPIETFSASSNSERIRRFIKGLLADKPPPDAAADAGYAPSAWRRLIKRHDVVAALKSENLHRDRVLSLTPARIQGQLANLAFADLVDIVNDDGTLKPISQIPPHARAAMQSLRTSFYTDADGVTSMRHQSVVMERKQPALETLADIIGLRDQHTMDEVARVFQVNIHLGAEGLAVGQERNRVAALARIEGESKPLLETTDIQPPADEKGN